MLPNSSLKRIYRFPSGKRARATRAVSSGMGGRAWGCNDIGLLLLVGSLVILTLFRLFYHLLLLPLLPFANRVFFCRNLFCHTSAGSRTSEKRLAPGVARATTSSRLLFERLSCRSARRDDRGSRPPLEPHSPIGEQPTGPVQPLQTLGLSLLEAPPLSLRSRRRPRLGPAPIAHRVAQHQHRIDVQPLPAHPSALEPCFDHQLVGALDAARSNGPARLLIAGILHVRFPLLLIGQFLLNERTGAVSRQPGQVLEHAGRSLL